jgi:hypothetical protein
LLPFPAMRRCLSTITLLLAEFPLNGQTAQGIAQRNVGVVVPDAQWQQSSPEAVDYSSAPSEDSGWGVSKQDIPAFGQPSDGTSRDSHRADFNRDIYYRNKLEYSFDAGWLPVNVLTWPLQYTLVPTIVSLRWHVTNIDGPWILRGNMDFTFGGSYTAIPRGAETRYFVSLYGIRRNFIQPGWRIVPYFELRGGVGNINAKGPDGVKYAQGQDLTFTGIPGSGVRYNFNPRYSVEAGFIYVHISNAYLSEPRYMDYGINVFGPIFGLNMRVGKQKPQTPK